MTAVCSMSTPLGAFTAVATAQGIGRLLFPDEPRGLAEAWLRRWRVDAPTMADGAEAGHLELQTAELTAYFAGDLRQFSVPLDLRGTPFQREVWRALLDVPFGQTSTYASIAAAIGRPSAVRAVGTANGANPVPLIVPCHRIIGSDGSLTGYAGGLTLKRRLLDIERPAGATVSKTHS